ncbi:MAG: N-acetylmuramoyl-L-alanine amidase-like domain-containing protein [Bacteroidota bacterium]
MMNNSPNCDKRFPTFVPAAFFVVSLFSMAACQPSESQPVQQATASAEALPGDTTAVAQFDALMAEARAKAWHTRDLGGIMMQVGVWFEGQPYVAGSLDESAYEQLVIKLDGFDCVTFVESVLALSRTIKSQAYNYAGFVDHMQAQRYRDGKLDGYCSRLHYFSEWILDNERRGRVQNITAEIGGVLLDKELDFMSGHRDSYAPLKDDSLYAGIVAMEANLKDLQMYHIPQAAIASAYPSLLGGDIVALATDIGGLDVTHTGLVFKHENGQVGLLHASTTRGVVVSPDLQAYVENNRRQIGIVVARPQDL